MYKKISNNPAIDSMWQNNVIIRLCTVINLGSKTWQHIRQVLQTITSGAQNTQKTRQPKSNNRIKSFQKMQPMAS